MASTVNRQQYKIESFHFHFTLLDDSELYDQRPATPAQTSKTLKTCKFDLFLLRDKRILNGIVMTNGDLL